MKKTKRPDNLAIEPRLRDRDYNFSDKKKHYWLNNDPVKTHFINALQATFPEGERFFIEAARDTVEIIKDEGLLDDRLEKDYTLFIQQEGIHSNKHSQWNASLVAAGYKKIGSYDEMLKKLRLWFRRHFSAKSRIAMTASAEHYTASLAWFLLYVDPQLLTEAKSPYKDLLLYHTMEELEHKSVCYDLYNRLSGGYISRVLWHIFISLDIVIQVYIRYRHLMKEDNLWDKEQKKKTRLFFLGREGILRKMWPQMRKYFKPSFHPWDTDEREEFENHFGALRNELGIPPFGRVSDSSIT